METEFETAGPTDMPRRYARAARPNDKWVRWSIYAAGSLILSLAAVVGLQLDPALLLGWAAGIIVAALLIARGHR